VAKLLRADGGCLGVKRRWKTWLAAISFGELLNKLWSGDFWMGKPLSGSAGRSVAEYIGCRGERGELKHLSSLRKRKQLWFPK